VCVQFIVVIYGVNINEKMRDENTKWYNVVFEYTPVFKLQWKDGEDFVVCVAR
jgi:hypothetical protein